MGKENLLKLTSCEFTGSFFNLEQHPKDRLPQIAFAGRSNVGKSSLLNKLVGIKRMAKVSSTPGKTQSINYFRINDRLYFVDLPGYGYAKVPKTIKKTWGEMIEEYLERSHALAGLVLLLDCRREPSDEDLQLLEWLVGRGLPVLIAVTKTDKITRNKTSQKVAQIEKQLGLPAIPFSTVIGTGKRELLMAINELLFVEN
jgi:GTP-binding protein